METDSISPAYHLSRRGGQSSVLQNGMVFISLARRRDNLDISAEFVKVHDRDPIQGLSNFGISVEKEEEDSAIVIAEFHNGKEKSK